MPQQRDPGLSLAEWLVLCLVGEGPTHCFAIASLLADDGSLGRVWHVRKAVVYRAAQRLEQLGLIMASEKQPSSQGPARGLPGRRRMAARAGRPRPGYPLGTARQGGPARPGRRRPPGVAPSPA